MLATYCLNSNSLYFQDPFELNFCVTKGYCDPALKEWRKRCDTTFNVLESGQNGLMAIFELPPLVPEEYRREKLREKIQMERANKSSATGPQYQFALVVPERNKTELNRCIMQIMKAIMQVSKYIIYTVTSINSATHFTCIYYIQMKNGCCISSP